MRPWRALLAAISGVLWLAPHPALAQDDSACGLRIIATIDMQTLEDGRVTVPVQVDGHDYRLMVDTGGYFNTLSSAAAKREGYEPKESQGTTLRGMGVVSMDHYIRIKDFAIGGMHGRNFDFFIDDFTGLADDGILGPQVLAAYDVEFDFARGVLRLISPDHCPGRVVHWTDEPAAVVPITMRDGAHIYIPVTIDGKRMTAMVDTGADTSYIALRAASRHLDIDAKNPDLKARGNIMVNGAAGPGYTYPFKTLEFGDVTVGSPNIRIVSDKVMNDDTLLLGVGILRQLHIYIAYKERKMYLTPALAGRAQSPVPPAQ